MKILAHRIKRELNLGESMQGAVYEDELKRLWPLNHKEREARIAPSLRRNTDSVSGFTARDCAQSSTSGRDQSDVCNSFQPNYDTTRDCALIVLDHWNSVAA
jgi:Uri superfamily endonuclease